MEVNGMETLLSAICEGGNISNSQLEGIANLLHTVPAAREGIFEFLDQKFMRWKWTEKGKDEKEMLQTFVSISTAIEKLVLGAEASRQKLWTSILVQVFYQTRIFIAQIVDLSKYLIHRKKKRRFKRLLINRQFTLF
jgi:hypothetical protein